MKKIGITFLCVMGMALSFVSCLDGDGENFQRVKSPAVVNNNSNMGGLTFLTWYGEIAVPSNVELNLNDCLIATFTVDYDNQPTSEYLTATNVVFDEVEQVFPEIVEEVSVEIGEDFLPIEKISTFAYTPIFGGKYFFQVEYIGSQNLDIKYQLTTSKDSIDAKTGARNVYLVAEKSKSSGSSSSTLAARELVLDMKNIVNSFGRDTLSTNKEAMRYANVNLNYCYGEKDGVPLFKSATSTPIVITILK